jgi:hypothetical protein
MFGIGKKHQIATTIAANMRRHERFIKSGSTDNRGKIGARITILGFLVVNTALLALFLKGPQGRLPFHLPISSDLNRVLFSTNILSMTGIKNWDLALGASTQAVAFSLLAAVLPLCTLIWINLRSRTQRNIYISFWGMTVGLPFIYVLFTEILNPLLLNSLVQSIGGQNVRP